MDSTRCLISCEERSCRHWETGLSAQFSSTNFSINKETLLQSFCCRQVIGRCKKSLGAGKEVIIDASTINAIFSRFIRQFLGIFLHISCSVLWHYPSRNLTEFGVVALLFCLRQPPIPRTRQWRWLSKMVISGVISNFLRLAIFPWIPPPSPPLSCTSRFRCFNHLIGVWNVFKASMAVTTRVRQTLTNFVRKIGGKPTQVSLCSVIAFLENHHFLRRFTLTPSSRWSRRSSTGPPPQTRWMKNLSSMKCLTQYVSESFGNFDMPDWWSQLSRNTLLWAQLINTTVD